MWNCSALAMERMGLWESAVESIRPMTQAVLDALAGKAAAGDLRAAKMFFQIVWKNNPDSPLPEFEGLSFTPALPVETPPQPQNEDEARLARELQAETDKLRNLVPETLQALADKAVSGHVKAIELYLKVVWNWADPSRRPCKQTPFSSYAALDGALRTMQWLAERADAEAAAALKNPGNGGERAADAWLKLLDLSAESSGLYEFAKIKRAELQAAKSIADARLHQDFHADAAETGADATAKFHESGPDGLKCANETFSQPQTATNAIEDNNGVDAALQIHTKVNLDNTIENLTEQKKDKKNTIPDISTKKNKTNNINICPDCRECAVAASKTSGAYCGRSPADLAVRWLSG